MKVLRWCEDRSRAAKIAVKPRCIVHHCGQVWRPQVHFPCLQGCVGGMWELCDGSGLVVRFAFAHTFTPLFTPRTPLGGCERQV